MSSLEEGERLAASVAVAPRVTLDDIKSKISAAYFVNAAQALGPGVPIAKELEVLTLCFLVMDNGFTIVGKSAPASPENFSEELGQKFSKEDAMRQVWPLMGFALRDRLANEARGQYIGLGRSE